MKTRITVIVDDASCDGIKGEWGLSILAEYAGKKILLDNNSKVRLFMRNSTAEDCLKDEWK